MFRCVQMNRIHDFSTGLELADDGWVGAMANLFNLNDALNNDWIDFQALDRWKGGWRLSIWNFNKLKNQHNKFRQRMIPSSSSTLLIANWNIAIIKTEILKNGLLITRHLLSFDADRKRDVDLPTITISCITMGDV